MLQAMNMDMPTGGVISPIIRLIGTLVALLILRAKVIKPVLAGAGKPKLGRPPSEFTRSTCTTKTSNRKCAAPFHTLGLVA